MFVPVNLFGSVRSHWNIRPCACRAQPCASRTRSSGSRVQAKAGLEEWKCPLQAESGRPPIVALGKFDALHRGHRSLAEQAARMGGTPWLLSFTGMAEVLGWPRRPPLVAECDREGVLASWAPMCGGLAPRQRSLPFSAVRHMSPQQFVDLLLELQVAGAVVGEGFRFGYKQAGNAEILKQLGEAAGMRVHIAELVGSAHSGSASQNVSSSEVRSALARGQMRQVQEYLDRPFQNTAQMSALQLQSPIRVSDAEFLNQLPGQQQYSADVKLLYKPGRQVVLKGCEVSVEDQAVLITHPNLEMAASTVSEAIISIQYTI